MRPASLTSSVGGGVGLSVHAPFRIATENTVFAMPETTIGFYPDVGASFFLSRLDGQLGKYLGLTSARLSGYEAFFVGIATHYVSADDLPALTARLAELDSTDLDTVNRALNDFVKQPVENDPSLVSRVSGPTRQAIDRCFAANDLPSILQALDKEGTEWASETASTIRQRSVVSCAVTLELLRRGPSLTISQALALDFTLAGHFVQTKDFVEGIEARLVHRREPQWTVRDLGDVDTDKFFSPLSPDFAAPLDSFGREGGDYKSYPWRKFALPRESQIKRFVTGYDSESGSLAMTRAEIVQHFVEQAGGKPGVAAKVLDVLARNCRRASGSTDTEEYLEWVD